MAYHNNSGLVDDSRNLSLRLGLDNRGPVRPVSIRAPQSTISSKLEDMENQISYLKNIIYKQNQAIFQLRKNNAGILNKLAGIEKKSMNKGKKTKKVKATQVSLSTSPMVESSNESLTPILKNPERTALFNKIKEMKAADIRKELINRNVKPIPRCHSNLVITLTNILDSENSARGKKRVRFEDEEEGDIAIRTDPSKSRRLTEEELPAVNPIM